MSVSKKKSKKRKQAKGTLRKVLLLSLACVLGFLVVSEVPKFITGNGSQAQANIQEKSGDDSKTSAPDSAPKSGEPAKQDSPKGDEKKSDPVEEEKATQDEDEGDSETKEEKKPELTLEQKVERYKTIHEAQKKVADAIKGSEIPSVEEGNKLIAGSKDYWGNQIQYKTGELSYSLVSSGPDGKFDDKDAKTKDDLTVGPISVGDWQKSIDTWFGDYLVTPMSTFLFFDFFTGAEPAVDANFDGKPDHSLTNAVVGFRRSLGISEKGWLGTSIPFVVIWLLLGGLFFTLRMSFINIRGFWHAIRLTKGDYDDDKNEGDVSHFQALSAALSATVGLGNIAGVAIAISKGGPGATFWMIVIGLIGMSSKFTECTLGQIYRKVDENGRITGGPMHYLKDGLAEMGMKKFGIILAFFFSILCIGGSFGGGNTFQVVQSLGAIREDPAFGFLDTYPWIYGVVMVLMVGAVIIGGIKVIGKVAGGVVPIMCGIYVAIAVIILILNAGQIPSAFAKIFTEAFNPQAIYGGFLGVLVIGITRAVFSNEAGTGSAAIAHSAAKTDIPVREGIVALLEPFIDTVIVCTMTALVIIVTNSYADPATQAVRDAGNGAALTSAAFQTGGYEFFKYFLYAAVFLFAFSTCISWSYYGERCWTHWFGQKSSMVYKILFLIFTFLGSIVSAANIQGFSDILILSMALPNVLGVLFLSGKVKRHLDDYWSRVKSGEIQPKK